VVALIDTNVLVYRFDGRFPGKQSVATEVLRRGIEANELVLPHQAIVEFVAAVTRRRGGEAPILLADEARNEAEELLGQFEVLYPTEAVVRTALRGMAAYRLSWFDAHLWAHAECYGIPEILSEDFEHDRWIGRVRIVDPFREAS
jgi:predicted nucleic acid-binding protein